MFAEGTETDEATAGVGSTSASEVARVGCTHRLRTSRTQVSTTTVTNNRTESTVV